MIPKYSFSTKISLKETKIVLEIFHNQLTLLKNHIESTQLEVKDIENSILPGDKSSIKRLSKTKERINELRAIHSVKLRFVRYMEKTIEEDDVIIDLKIEITQKT